MGLPLELKTVVTIAALGVIAVFVVHFLVHHAGAYAEDRAWRASRRLLGEGAAEVIAWDTRLMRPFGGSTALETFVQLARPKGYIWLEPVVAPWDRLRPIGIRAILTEVEGLPAAYVHCYPRSPIVPAKLCALSPAGRVHQDELETKDGCPPRDLVARLEALAREAREVIPEEGSVRA